MNRRGQPKGMGGPPVKHMNMMMLQFFAPDPPLEFKKPMPRPRKKTYTGLAEWVGELSEEPEEAPREVTTQEKRDDRRRAAKALHEQELKERLSRWKPKETVTEAGGTEKAMNTLFVGRLAYITTEQKLKRECEVYGTVKKVVIVTDKAGKSRGYGFVEFENERDMRAAHQRMDGKRIDGRNVVVDVERGRT
eukprot:CAMPEP_0203817862 /NCGR_PEP_ID=MMETSP0115-20131106/28782_1 /ASSEMBLY_ACC=CAM_ASM_000227 /TAXON_ID=33651 /ORGANISM="Bicosoecid sp, Strain ms1" /LENGTH=191 /DNA_ID=CAMNT_0050726807 /DNA_START=206 /DNA_END=778 /DNA_ORIENTATION=+